MAETTEKKPKTKQCINVHPLVHTRYFDRIMRERERAGKPNMSAEDFLVDLLDMYDKMTNPED